MNCINKKLIFHTMPGALNIHKWDHLFNITFIFLGKLNGLIDSHKKDFSIVCPCSKKSYISLHTLPALDFEPKKKAVFPLNVSQSSQELFFIFKKTLKS